MISRACAIALVLACGCSTSVPHTESPRPAQGARGDRPAIRLLPVVITHSTPGYLYDVGDTLTIDLDGDPQAAGFPIFIGGYDTGRVVPGVHVGPRHGGMMIVAATNLNVRVCPRTDCPIVASLPRGTRVQVGPFSAGWYALADGSGYVSAEHLMMPEADLKEKLRRVVLEVDLFYHDRVRPVRWQDLDTDRPLLDAPRVSLVDGVLRIDLSTRAVVSGASGALCDLLRALNDFAAGLVRDMHDSKIVEYEIQVRPATGDGAPVARSTSTDVYCRTAWMDMTIRTSSPSS